MNLPQELILLIVEFLDVSSRFAFGCITRRFTSYLNVKDSRLSVCNDAISNKYNDLVKWLIPDGYCEKLPDTIMISSESTHEYEYVIDHRSCFFVKCMPTDLIRRLCVTAANACNFDVLKYLCNDIKLPRKTSIGIFGAIVTEGSLDTSKWFYTHHMIDIDRPSNMCTIAASSGHLEILKWLRANGFSWDTTTCFNTAMKGQLEILQYLHENGCLWNEWTCSLAAETGHLDVLKYVRSVDNKCPWSALTFKNAAMNGHLEIVVWLHENGCPTDWKASVAAAENGHLNVLKYLRNAYPDDHLDRTYAMAGSNHPEVLAYLHETGCPFEFPDQCTYCNPKL